PTMSTRDSRAAPRSKDARARVGAAAREESRSKRPSSTATSPPSREPETAERAASAWASAASPAMYAPSAASPSVRGMAPPARSRAFPAPTRTRSGNRRLTCTTSSAGSSTRCWVAESSRRRALRARSRRLRTVLLHVGARRKERSAEFYSRVSGLIHQRNGFHTAAEAVAASRPSLPGEALGHLALPGLPARQRSPAPALAHHEPAIGTASCRTRGEAAGVA